MTSFDPTVVGNAASGAGAGAVNGAGVGGGGPSRDSSPRAGAATPIIDPRKPPPMKTLIYSPEVKIVIARGNKSYDVSSDVVGGQIVRRENAVSSASFQLSNKDMRYNGRFERMDRVMIWMKRVSMVQVFAGYLDSVPHRQLYGGVVSFRASCTLKRLLHTWWDPGLPSSMSLFNLRGINANASPDGQGFADSGIGALLRDLLMEVGGWSRETIHIQQFPEQFLKFLADQMVKMKGDTSAEVMRFRRLLLSDDTSGGLGEGAGRQYDVTMGAYGGTSATYIRDIVAACDERQMGPIAQNTANAAGVIGATTAPGDPRYLDTQRWEDLGKAAQDAQTAARDSDAAILGVACAMAESGLLNLANATVSTSMTFPNDGIAPGNYDSCGLFQQRPSQGWGTVAQEMNPRAAAGMFFNALARIQDWRNMDPATAITRVQNNAGGAATYAAFVPEAKAIVQAYRSGKDATSSTSLLGGAAAAGSSIIQPGAAALGNDLATAAAGAVNNVSQAAVPLSTSTPLGSAAAAVTGAPSGTPDTAGAIAYALQQVAAGVMYKWGGKSLSDGGLDCSGLTEAAYKAIGMDIGRGTDAQYARGQKIAWSQIQPGDLIMPHNGHVVMWLGNGMIAEAYDTGYPLRSVPIWFDPTSVYAILHYPPATYRGNPAFNPPETAGPGSPPSTGGSGGHTEPIARNLFSYMFEPGQFQSKISTMFRDEKAYLNDEPLIQMVQMVARAGLRHFQSAPNGDLIFYYPDWFGLDGGKAVIHLEDIEMKDVKIDMCDDTLTTHVYVSGDYTGMGQSQGPLGWLQSYGVASVESEWLFKRMIDVAPGLSSLDSSEILRRFGVRPYREEFTAVHSPQMEFLLAVQTFMKKWADQYRTSCQFTFLPELFPGMRVNLAGHNLQVYVSEVTHTFDWENGFSTSAVIQAPSSTGDAGEVKKPAANGTDTGWGSEYFF